jgi:ADP-heptose:LPS heptosyltransferase
MFDRHIQTFEQLGFSVNLNQPEFPNLALSEKTHTISGEKNNQKWIGIAPFAQYQSKVYPIDLMQQVIAILAKNSNYQIFLFGGGKHETEILNSFSTNKKNCIVVAGKLDLLHELQLISQLDVMVSMDSGNGHIAAMLGKKVITLWGATHPFAGFAPFNQPMELSLTADRQKYPLLPTSVYGNKIVEGYQDVMRSISVESVVNKINSVINQ